MITLKENSRTLLVPEEEKYFGVESDEKVEYRLFEIPRFTANGMDLSSFALRINYFNAAKDPGQYLVKDAEVNGDMISFSWEFSRKVTAAEGKVLFIICAVSLGESGEIVNEWNTEPAEGTVGKGLEVSDPDVGDEEDIPEAVESAMLLINQRAQEVIDSIPDDYAALTEAVDGLKRDVGKLSEEIGQLKQNGTGTVTGLSTEAIDKLEEVGNYLAYTTADGGSKWIELISILRSGSSGGGSGETDVTLSSISATYNGGDVPVGTALTSLTGITVTAHYSDGSTANTTGYTLSGTIAEGSNTITVSYGGKTTTFTVTGVAESSGDTGGEDTGDGTEWTDGVPYEYTLVENEYVSSNGLKPYNGWSRTTYLPCRGASSITLSFADGSKVLPSGAYSAWYDADKTMITNFNPRPSNFSNIPEDTCYLIISQDHTTMTNIASITPHA